MGAGVENTRPGGENGEEETADFGFRRVRRGEKASLVRAVFDGVADRYDLMNDLMSLGVHRAWKRGLIDWLAPRPGMRLLDVAGGTGDVAFRFLDRLGGGPRGRREGAAAGGVNAIVCDVNESMIRVGRARAIDRGLLRRIDWLCGNAEALPLAARSADAYTIAFGLRNVTDVPAALAEARRVLRPGGRFLCLEFSQVVVPLLAEGYERYSFDVVPWLGQLVTGRGDAYRYLVESIRRFPDQETLAGMIAAAGLGQVTYRNLTGGVAALHSAWRI